MKKSLLFLVALTALVTGCMPGPAGEVVGVYPREEWVQVNPYGMNYVHFGSFTMGNNDRDLVGGITVKSKTVTISPFYIDQHEISNNEYRQFVYWVIDSIAHVKSGHVAPNQAGIDSINWEEPLDWSPGGTLDGMFYQGDEKFANKRNLDVRQLQFDYQWYDWKNAANDFDWKTDNNRHSKEKHNRAKYIKRESLRIYPDTLCWVRDFSYSYNEPMTRNYFNHPAFDDYPVVGVAWKQAMAFCYWRTNLWDGFEEVNTEDFRLPTEHEWEYASRGGHQLTAYPWGNYYVRNAKGCLLANFKPGRGDYPADGGLYTVKADGYFPNDYGLYCMAGNVAEWTSSAYYENA